MRLSEYLKNQGESQLSFARRVHCTQARVSQILSGAHPSLRLAQRIAAATHGAVSLGDWPEPRREAA